MHAARPCITGQLRNNVCHVPLILFKNTSITKTWGIHNFNFHLFVIADFRSIWCTEVWSVLLLIFSSLANLNSFLIMDYLHSIGVASSIF